MISFTVQTTIRHLSNNFLLKVACMTEANVKKFKQVPALHTDLVYSY